MHWRDLHDDDPARRWWGLTFQRADGARASLRMQAAPEVLRLSARGQAVLWARIADDHCDYDYLIAQSPWQTGVQVVPPLSFEQVHRIEQQPLEARPRLWARAQAMALLSSGTSPVDRDEHVLLRCEAPPYHGTRPRAAHLPPPTLEDWQVVSEQRRSDTGRWDFSKWLPPLSLKDPKRTDAGRIDAWRKAVRARTAPPVLLWWQSGLDRFVIVDGLHRALAWLAEGIAPECFALMRFGALRGPKTVNEDRAAMTRGIEQALFANEQPTITVPSANQMLIDAYDTRPGVSGRSTAWPIPGGRVAWRREVERELSASTVSDCALLDASDTRA